MQLECICYLLPVTNFIIHSHVEWFLQKMKQTVLPMCSYLDMTAQPNRNGGHTLLSANLFSAVWLASSSVESKHGCVQETDDRKHDKNSEENTIQLCDMGTYWCNQCEGFNRLRMLGCHGQCNDAAHGVSNYVVGIQLQWPDHRCLNHVEVFSHCIRAVCWLWTSAKTQEIHCNHPEALFSHLGKIMEDCLHPKRGGRKKSM